MVAPVRVVRSRKAMRRGSPISFIWTPRIEIFFFSSV